MTSQCVQSLVSTSSLISDNDENGTKSLNWLHGYRADCTMQSQTQNLDRTTARKPWSIERLHRSHGQSKSRIKPEPRYQQVTVTESSQSNVVKLEPSTGPTLFLNRTTADRSSATAIRIQYCASCMTRTGTAARKGSIQGQQQIGKQAPRKR